MIGELLGLGGKLIDEMYESEEERKSARLALLKLQQEGHLKSQEQRQAVLLAEARSQDPWTSRARPAFLYVCYILMLFGVVIALVAPFSSEAAQAMAHAITGYLSGLPDALYGLLGTVMLGYQAARSYDKGRLLKAKKDAELL